MDSRGFSTLLCILNIVFLIASTVFFTYGTLIHNIRGKCLSGINICAIGNNALCQLGKVALAVEVLHLMYATFLFVTSFYTVISNCCSQIWYSAKKVSYHICFNGFALAICLAVIIAVCVFDIRLRDERAGIKSMLEMYHHLGLSGPCYDYLTVELNSHWNLVTTFLLFVCLAGHFAITVLARSFTNRSDFDWANFRTICSDHHPATVERARKAKTTPEQALKPIAEMVNENEPRGNRLRLPSTRGYPSSPIIPVAPSPK